MKALAMVAIISLVLLAGCQRATFESATSPSASPALSATTPTTGPNSESAIPTLSTTMSTIVPNSEFENDLNKAEYYSTSVEIMRTASRQKVILDRTDPRFAEFIHVFHLSITGSQTVRYAKAINGSPGVTIPYVLGDILTFNLSGSILTFDCATDKIWHETNAAIYKAGFSQEFRLFLDDLISSPDAPTQLSIPIQPSANEFLFRSGSGGIVLKSVAVRSAVLDKDYMDIHPPGTTAKKGEPCLLLTGQVESQLARDTYMTMVARGFNSAGEEVAHVLDAGPIYGVISVFLPANGMNGFIIHLNAAPDVTKIVLLPSDQLYDIPPP
jgi:hypothetical protein